MAILSGESVLRRGFGHFLGESRMLFQLGEPGKMGKANDDALATHVHETWPLTN
jgi:hypothetical protein